MGTTASSAIAEATAPAACEVRVVIVDCDHARRQLMGYVAKLGSEHLSVVGNAEGPESAVDAVARSHANAALVEIQLPVARGLETISALRTHDPQLRIIVCTFHKSAVAQEAALAQGADAYLLKPLSPRELYQQLRPIGIHQGDPSDQ